MSAPRLPLEPTVRFASGSDSCTLEPCVEDLLETQLCTPGSILLVEGIDDLKPISPNYRAVRLLLGDGELCIQALVAPEMHRVVDSGLFHLGCYVRLDWFELRFIPVRPIPVGESLGLEEVLGGQEDQEGLEDEEEVFLIVRDMCVVGWDTARVQTTTSSRRQGMNAIAHEESLVAGGPKVKTIGREGRKEDCTQTSMGRRLLNPVVIIAAQNLSRSGITQDSTAEPPTQQDQGAGSNDQEAISSQSSRTASSTNLPRSLYNPSKPLKLTPLKSIPNLPYKQNWVVNVLAVVASLSGVELAILPPNKQPFKQRTARLADPSTSKQVLLTVFLDPEAFTPAVGSVVLLLAVKNHRFDGGSLKKYGNEIVKDESGWWFENPQDIEWCDVDGLARWWAEKCS